MLTKKFILIQCIYLFEAKVQSNCVLCDQMTFTHTLNDREVVDIVPQVYFIVMFILNLQINWWEL